MAGTRPPRVVIVFAERGPRALLRAELREAGYDAIGASSLATALRYPPVVSDRGPVRLFILDHPAAAAAPALLERARTRYAGSRFLLITGPGRAAPGGPWDRVLPRPLTIGDIVAAVRRLVPLPADLRVPLDR